MYSFVNDLSEDGLSLPKHVVASQSNSYLWLHVHLEELNTV
jgi:hypothetical protein